MNDYTTLFLLLLLIETVFNIFLSKIYIIHYYSPESRFVFSFLLIAYHVEMSDWEIK